MFSYILSPMGHGVPCIQNIGVARIKYAGPWPEIGSLLYMPANKDTIGFYCIFGTFMPFAVRNWSVNA